MDLNGKPVVVHSVSRAGLLIVSSLLMSKLRRQVRFRESSAGPHFLGDAERQQNASWLKVPEDAAGFEPVHRFKSYRSEATMATATKTMCTRS